MQRSSLVSAAVKHFDKVREQIRAANPKADPRTLIELCWSSFTGDEKRWLTGEILKCRQDFRYLAGNYIWLYQPRSGRPTTLDVNDAQELLLESIEFMWGQGKPGWILVHKARQMGISTLALALAVWQSAFFSNRVCMFIAQDAYHAPYVFRAFQYNMFNLPYWMQPNVHALEEKESMVLATQDETGWGGLNNYILSFQANKMSAFAQGKAVTFLWLTEVSNFPEDKARRIIKGDLRAALVSRPGCIAIGESKPEGASGFWYDWWHQHYGPDAKGMWRSVFFPVFMEKSRVAKVPPTFKPNKQETEVRERYQIEWKRCTSCSTAENPVYFYAGGSDLAECLRCGGNEGEGVILTDEQLGWYRTMEAEVKTRRDRKLFKQEFAVTAEEGFQIMEDQVFPDDVIEQVEKDVRDPNWIGELRNDFSWHNKIPMRCVQHKGEKHCLACHEDHSQEEEMYLSIWEFPQTGATYHIGCLPDGEEIITARGLVDIEKVKADDLLLDGCGKYTKIEEIMRRPYQGEMIEIRTIGSPFPVRLTPEHPVLVFNRRDPGRVLSRSKLDPTWVEARNVKPHDIVGVAARPQIETTGSDLKALWPDTETTRPDFVQGILPMLDSRFWWFIGLYLADGWTRKDGKQFDVAVGLNALKEQYLAAQLREVVQQVFSRKTAERNHGNSLEVKFSSPEFVDFLAQFGSSAHSKFVPEWCLGLPREYRLAIVKGYWQGDGCEQKQGTMAFTSVSYPLLRGMQRLLMSVGYFASVKLLREAGVSYFKHRNGRPSQHSRCYEMKLSMFRSNDLLEEFGVPRKYEAAEQTRSGKSWMDKHRAYVKVRSVTSVPYEGFVNNFKTASGSYTSRLLTVHNCDASYGFEEGDYGVITVLKQGKGMTEPDVQVAEYRGRIDAGELGTMVYLLGMSYGEAEVAIEVQNGPGEKTQYSLMQKNYDHVWVWKHYDAKRPLTNRFGWVTNLRTKPMLVQTFIQWTRAGLVKFRSKNFLSEIKSFVRRVEYDDSGMGAARGRKDDAAMAGLICLFTFHDEHWDEERGRVIIPTPFVGEQSEVFEGTDKRYWVTCFNGHQMGVDNPRGFVCPECKKQDAEHKVFAASAIPTRKASPQRRIDLDGPNMANPVMPSTSDQVEIL